MLHAKDDRTVPYVLGQKVATVQSSSHDTISLLFMCVLYLQIVCKLFAKYLLSVYRIPALLNSVLSLCHIVVHNSYTKHYCLSTVQLYTTAVLNSAMTLYHTVVHNNSTKLCNVFLSYIYMCNSCTKWCNVLFHTVVRNSPADRKEDTYQVCYI